MRHAAECHSVTAGQSSGKWTGSCPSSAVTSRWQGAGTSGLSHCAVTTQPRVTVEGGSSAGTLLPRSAPGCRLQISAGSRVPELLVPAGPCQLNLVKTAQHSKLFSSCISITFSSPCQVTSCSVLMESAGGWARAALLLVGMLPLLEGSSQPSLCMEPRFLRAAARRWHLRDKTEKVNGLSYNVPHKI